MNVKFEYLGEDQEYPGSKTWSVEAIHVTTTRNKRKFTESELQTAARSLSYRPLNINHELDRQLSFPQNATLAMHYEATARAVVGQFRVSDPTINAMIETGRINQVSIEQLPTLGEDCSSGILCEQHGVTFIGMALLESDIPPGDINANIKKESLDGSVRIEKLSELIISEEQRACKECTDFEMCNVCKHKIEQDDECIKKWIKKISDEDKSRPRDQIIAMAHSKCKPDGTTKKESWMFYNKSCKILHNIWNNTN